MSTDPLPPPPRLRRARESLNRCLLRQPAFVPQSRDYGESRGFGGPGNRYNPDFALDSIVILSGAKNL